MNRLFFIATVLVFVSFDLFSQKAIRYTDKIKFTDTLDGYLITVANDTIKAHILISDPLMMQNAIRYNSGNDYKVANCKELKGYFYLSGENWIYYQYNPTDELLEQRLVNGEPYKLFKVFELIIVQGTSSPSFGSPSGTGGSSRKTIISYFELLDARGNISVRIHKKGFLKDMKHQFQNDYPELIKKLGKKGYRYDDLPSIIGYINSTSIKKG